MVWSRARSRLLRPSLQDSQGLADLRVWNGNAWTSFFSALAINTVRGGVSGNGDTIGSTTTPGGVSGTGVSTPYPVGFVHGVSGVEMHVGLMTAALLASFGSVSLSFYVQPVGITADGVVLPVPEPRTCALLLVGVAVLLASYLFGPRWPWARLLRRVFASRSSSVCCGGPRRSWAR